MTAPSLSQEDILARVTQVLQRQLGDAFANAPADADIRDSLGDAYDSLIATECIYAIEGEFGIQVDFTTDDVRYWFSSAQRMSEFVLQRLEDSEVLRA